MPPILRLGLPDMVQFLPVRTDSEVDSMIVCFTVFLGPCPNMRCCFLPIPQSILHQARYKEKLLVCTPIRTEDGIRVLFLFISLNLVHLLLTYDNLVCVPRFVLL